MTIRFDEAWLRAFDVAKDAVVRHSLRVTLVRDLIGRVSVILDDRSSPVPNGIVTELSSRLTAEAGAFVSPNPVLLASDLFEPDHVLAAGAPVVIAESAAGQGQLTVMDRGAVGGAWDDVAVEPPTNRVTLYGFKGGVGRSTAAFMLAQHLANTGRCVLVVDLDLESPGIGALLQDEEFFPDYGLVDHIIEAAVGNESGLEIVTRSKVVQPSQNGEVWLAPAGGRPRAGYDYLAKLNRVYVDLPAAGNSTSPLAFSQRLASAIAACEDEVELRSRAPDVVLLDSRAGIHDIAAVAMTQLSDLSLLFAMDNPQTWAGYSALFERWSQNTLQARAIRERLKMVAAFVPNASERDYLAGFRDRAQECFASSLYDDASSDDSDAFNPAPEDDTAPHSPLPIVFSSELVTLDPSAHRDWYSSTFVVAAYRRFLDAAEQLIFGGPS